MEDRSGWQRGGKPDSRRKNRKGKDATTRPEPEARQEGRQGFGDFAEFLQREKLPLFLYVAGRLGDKRVDAMEAFQDMISQLGETWEGSKLSDLSNFKTDGELNAYLLLIYKQKLLKQIARLTELASGTGEAEINRDEIDKSTSSLAEVDKSHIIDAYREALRATAFQVSQKYGYKQEELYRVLEAFGRQIAKNGHSAAPGRPKGSGNSQILFGELTQGQRRARMEFLRKTFLEELESRGVIIHLRSRAMTAAATVKAALQPMQEEPNNAGEA